MKSGVTLTGDERHGYEWSEEKALQLPTLYINHRRVYFVMIISASNFIING